jgi:polyisoprenoid-binding protein YceI
MHTMRRWILAALVATGMTSVEAARAAEFVVHPGNDNRVVFVSNATMETFEGKTNRMEGHLTVNPAAIGDSIVVHVEVDLASLDTGIGKRNQHMKSEHLETDKYPKAIFDGASVHGPANAKLEPGKAVMFDVEGTFSLHGVSRRLRTQIEATYTEQAGAGRIAFKTTFPVGLSDYNISRPQFLFLKLAEAQQVKVSGVAVAAP